MAYTFDNIEDCSRAIRLKLQEIPGIAVVATYAPGTPTQYHRFIVLTQRLMKNGNVIAYITYRSSRSAEFSSYEILDPSYSKSLLKVHVKDDQPVNVLKYVLGFLEDLCK